MSLQGLAPGTRARAYESFIVKHPRSRFVTVLREEIELLRRGDVKAQPYAVSSPQLDRVRPGAPQHYAVELDPRFTGAVVHVRRKGERGFRSIPMSSAGPRYWSAIFPGDAVAEPGLEYFVEGVQPTGTPIAVVGSAPRPREVSVDASPFAGKKPDTLAQATIQSEYASFNTRKANDYVFQTEGAFGWRMRDVGIRAIRSGFGVLRGEGGSLRDLDELGRDPKRVGLTYGWLELELAFASRYALIARPILGLREGGLAGGAQGFVRIGNDLATNLSIGGELLGSVGLRGIVQLDWRTIPRIPVLLRTEVTNQPAGIGSDVGARAIAQVGYELAPAFVLALRGSYQGRTINHAGPGAGLAASYQW